MLASSTNKIPCYDVVIVGAGIAGCALAISLGQLQRKVLLIDKVIEKKIKVGEGLPPAANDFLKQLGVWDSFLEQKHLPSYGNAAAWGSEQLIYQDFLMQGNGWHIDRLKFENLLLEKTKEVETNCELGSSIQTIEKTETGNWLLKIKKENNNFFVKSKFLVDATGRNSFVIKKLGFQKLKEQRLIGFWKIFTLQKNQEDKESLSLIESVENGWWYTALLPEGKRMVVFFTEPKTPIIESMSSLDAFQSLIAQTRHIQKRLEKFVPYSTAPPKAAAAGSATLSKYCGKDWLAVGDAAISFDPISSQGIINALYSGILAAKTIDETMKGNVQAIDHYQNMLAGIWKRYQFRLHEIYLQKKTVESKSF